MFREIPPTAGFPLYFQDFLSIFRTKNRWKCLEDEFEHYLNIDFARVTYSGTAAFYLILESLKKISRKKTVIIPSFICPIIPLAVKRAGLNVEICDINRDDFNYNIRGLKDLCKKDDDVLAILVAHLAGIPADFDSIKDIAGNDGIFIIEDCAQSLGALYKGKKVGTLGAFSFFSFCRGKGLTTYEGGLIATVRTEYAELIDNTIKELAVDDPYSEVSLTMLLFGYWLFYRPLLFWFVFRLPQIFWKWRGEKLKAAMEYFEIDFPIHKISSTRQLIGQSQFLRLDKETDRQRQKASIYMERLNKIKGIKIIAESNESRATYPFLTLLFDNPAKKDRALEIFENSGMGVSFVYALAIADYDYLRNIVPDRNCSNARGLAGRAITLSTSTFLKDEDIDTISAIISSL